MSCDSLASLENMTTLGMEINRLADLQMRADYLIIRTTMEYLEGNLDDEGMSYWRWFVNHFDNHIFLRRFFEKYSNVFSGVGNPMWVCRNPSAAAIATMRESFHGR